MNNNNNKMKPKPCHAPKIRVYVKMAVNASTTIWAAIRAHAKMASRERTVKYVIRIKKTLITGVFK
jgi:hypothetical protein